MANGLPNRVGVRCPDQPTSATQGRRRRPPGGWGERRCSRRLLLCPRWASKWRTNGPHESHSVHTSVQKSVLAASSKTSSVDLVSVPRAARSTRAHSGKESKRRRGGSQTVRAVAEYGKHNYMPGARRPPTGNPGGTSAAPPPELRQHALTWVCHIHTQSACGERGAGHQAWVGFWHPLLELGSIFGRAMLKTLQRLSIAARAGDTGPCGCRLGSAPKRAPRLPRRGISAAARAPPPPRCAPRVPSYFKLSPGGNPPCTHLPALLGFPRAGAVGGQRGAPTGSSTAAHCPPPAAPPPNARGLAPGASARAVPPAARQACRQRSHPLHNMQRGLPKR